MTRKSVLLLSDDAQFVRACAELDVDVTVVCGSMQKNFGQVVIPSGTHQVFVYDATSVESVLTGLYRAGHDPSAFDAVATSDESAVVTAAVLGAAFDVPALSPGVAARFRDKSLQKAVVRAAGIDAAQYVVIEDLCAVTEDFTLPFEPAVLKPIAGGAAYKTSVLTGDVDLRAAVRRASSGDWSLRTNRTFILEEFVPGDEWHADGVMFDGELRFVSIGGYRQTCLTTVTEQRPLNTFLFDPVDDAAVYERVTPLAERALRALGLDNGVFHLEVFHDPASGRLTFGECAARRGGGLIEEETFHKFGVSLTEAAVRCALGVDPTVPAGRRTEVVGTAYLPQLPGTLIGHPSTDELTALPGVEFATIELPLGFTMGSVLVDTQMKIGQVLLTAGSRQELFRRADEVVAWFVERTVVIPAEATPAQLRRWQAQVTTDRPAALLSGSVG